MTFITLTGPVFIIDSKEKKVPKKIVTIVISYV